MFIAVSLFEAPRCMKMQITALCDISNAILTFRSSQNKL